MIEFNKGDRVRVIPREGMNIPGPIYQLLDETRWEATIQSLKIERDIGCIAYVIFESCVTEEGIPYNSFGFSINDLEKLPNNETHDPVNHPKHYTGNGIKCACHREIECIDIVRHFGFNLGNVIKYVWRADRKNGLEDLKKAQWYLNDHIARLEANPPVIVDCNICGAIFPWGVNHDCGGIRK